MTPLASSASTGSATFDQRVFAQLAAAEPGHFWFEQRRQLLVWALKRYFPGAKSFCEVGCGTGYVLEAIEAGLPDLALTGLEYFPEALPHARRRLKKAALVQGDICNLPFEAEFDVVGCFDVLEHIPDDRLALQNLTRAIRPGGGLLLTVPESPALWSQFDEAAHHQRRYRAAGLRARIAETGLICQRTTSFMSLLAPMLWLSRRRAGSAQNLLDRQLNPSPLINRIGKSIFGFERRLIARGISFPWGSSLLFVASKPQR